MDQLKVGIHQYIPYLHAPGDATADLVYAFQQAFREWGYRSDIYCLEADPDVSEWLSAREYHPDAQDLSIYHYACGSDITGIFAQLDSPRLVYYHNVTPSEFVRPFHGPLADDLELGRHQIRELCHLPALVPSEYSRAELLEIGFRDVQVVPLLLDFSRLIESTQNEVGQQIIAAVKPEECIWLAVGRIAPNKRCEDIIKAFAYYHRFINRISRLVFVGGAKQFAAYEFNLHRLTDKLGISNSIQWSGWVGYDNGFGSYYQIASVYVHMSEHEGFGVPLLEAMRFSVPVIAYASSAVPETVGTSGILVHEKDYETVAELAHMLFVDTDLRTNVIERQTSNLPRYRHPVILQRLRSALAPFLPVR